MPGSGAELIARGAERLHGAGLPEPRRESLQLWADLHDTTPAAAFLQREIVADAATGAEFLARIERRAAGEPRAYVSGMTEFRHLALACDRRALIPRPETEGVVDLLLQRVGTGRIADIGTGTGCLALSLAVEGSFSQVVAVDRSADALALAAMNARAVAGRGGGGAVALIRGDLTWSLQTGAFDALVTNPPYLTEEEYAAIDPSVRDWEPALALVSGRDGLDATTALLDDGRRVVRPGGWIVIELDCTRAAATARRAVQFGWQDVTVDHDLFGRERYLLARRSEIS